MTRHGAFQGRVCQFSPTSMRHDQPLNQNLFSRRRALRAWAKQMLGATLLWWFGPRATRAQAAVAGDLATFTHAFASRIFALLASDEPARFYDHVADDVHWTVLGTHPLAGSFSSKAAFREGDLRRLAALFDATLKIHVRRVLLDGDMAVAELYSHAVTKDGLPYDNEYCWLCRFADEKIVEVRAYVDSALVAKVVQVREANG